jgi:endonuclease/exonuclease/phosphatase family metal-dependent hydrolase
MMQAQELLGETWLGNPECKGPVILCGDFNVFKSSKVFKLLDKNLTSVRKKAERKVRKATWFGRFPFVSLDHIFVSDEFEVATVEVADSHLARLASDHRPLLVDLKLRR